MRLYTNLAWPEDPFGTGQLWRRALRLIAGIKVYWDDQGNDESFYGFAFAYLRVPRVHKRPVMINGEKLGFGFKALGTSCDGEKADLCKELDLDLMQARRHAEAIAGHQLRDTLSRVKNEYAAIRGVGAIIDEWGEVGSSGEHRATICDMAQDNLKAVELEKYSRSMNLLPSKIISREEVDRTANLGGSASVSAWEGAIAKMVQEALLVALIGSAHFGFYRWEDPISIKDVLINHTWDCFPSVEFINA